MLGLLLFQIGAVAMQDRAAGAFDLADYSRPPIAIPKPRARRVRSRYLTPELEEPGSEDHGVRVRLRGRKVRVNVPLG